MRLFPVVLAVSLCILTLTVPALAASVAVEVGNVDVGSLIGLLICGVVIGGVVSASRTRSRGPASK